MAIEDRAWDFIIRVPPIPFDYQRSALVVIDMQNLFASREYGIFKRLADAGLGEEGEYAISRIEETVTPNIRKLADAFRRNGLPVVFARCASVRGDGSDQTARHRAQNLIVPEWSAEAQIIHELEPEQGDIVITKTGSGCFTSTNLDHLLHNLGVTGVVLVGTWTNSCVETAARHAGDLDYQVVVVDDACVAATPENHAWALRYLDNNFGSVKRTAEVLPHLDTVPSTAGVA